MLFVKEAWFAQSTPIHVNAQAILARIQFAANKSVVVGSCHLPPFGERAPERLGQTLEMLRHVHQDDKLVLAGDFNMRQKEDKAVEALDLLDAWKADGEVYEKKFTWNSFVNRFHLGGFQNRGRYDRIYLRGFTVDAFQKCANTPASDNPGHFLSDHFGLRAVIRANNN